MWLTTVTLMPHLEVNHDGLYQDEDDRVVLPVDVGGRLAEFHTGDGRTLRQLFAATMTCQCLAQVLQEQLLQRQRLTIRGLTNTALNPALASMDNLIHRSSPLTSFVSFAPGIANNILDRDVGLTQSKPKEASPCWPCSLPPHRGRCSA